MKKLLSILLSLVLCSIIAVSSISASGVSTDSDKLPKENQVPIIEKIKEKAHFKKFIEMKSDKERDDYLGSLKTSELLTTIAEASDEYQKDGDFFALIPFASHSQKIVDDLTVDKKISIIKNKDYSTYFKYFMIDIEDSYKKLPKWSF